MPQNPAPDVAQIRMYYTQAGQIMANVYHAHWGGAGPMTEANMTAIGEAVLAWRNANQRQDQVVGCVLDRIEVLDLGSAGTPGITILPPANVKPGTNADAALPNNATCVISWRTAKRGRSYRGRTYHCGLGASAQLNSRLTDAAIAGIQAHYQALISAVAGSVPGTVVHLSVLSRFQNGVELATPVATTITTAVVDAPLDSQRRRLPGRGA